MQPPPGRPQPKSRMHGAHIRAAGAVLEAAALLPGGARAHDRLSGALLGACGFELRRQGPLEYWFHPATARPTNSQADSHVSDGALPLVVLHGVGGLTGYLPLLLRIRSLQPEWPLIVPLFPQCSLPLPSHDPSPLPADHIKLTLDAIVAMIARHSSNSRSSPRAAFLAHSLGTAVFASLCKAHPTVIGPSLLADPICFLLYRRDVLHNFLYRKPRPLAHLLSSHGHGLRGPNALHLGYWFRLAIHAVLTQEPTIQSCFRREFWWTRHWLHPSDLPADALVVLSGRDADRAVAQGARLSAGRGEQARERAARPTH